MRDPDFFLHRYAPTTNLMAFLEVPYDKLVDCIAQWERKRDKYREVPVQKTEIGGTWEQRLNSLLPLTLHSPKTMISETQSPWCVYVDNGMQGTDIYSDPSYLCQILGVHEIAITMVRDIPKIKPGSTQFSYSDGSRAKKLFPKQVIIMKFLDVILQRIEKAAGNLSNKASPFHLKS